MQVEVLREPTKVESSDSLLAAIRMAAETGLSCVWIRADSGSQLAIMLNGKIGYPHYFPASDHPGFQLKPAADADWETEVEFIADNREPTPMPAALTTGLPIILSLSKEFYESDGQLPNSQVEWAEL